MHASTAIGPPYTLVADEEWYGDGLADRVAAGRRLAERLQHYRGGRALVLALPPGGVAVAAEVAHALRLPLDVLVAREFCVAPHRALTAGAISEGGGLCFNRGVLRLPGVAPQNVWREARRARAEIALLVAAYRRGRALPTLHRRPVILVDDGLGDGLVQLAAIQSLHGAHVYRCVVATPAGTRSAVERVANRVNELVSLRTLEDDHCDEIGHWRLSMGDDQAPALLDACRRRASR